MQAAAVRIQSSARGLLARNRKQVGAMRAEQKEADTKLDAFLNQTPPEIEVRYELPGCRYELPG
jgi:hypothetical protein